MLDKHLPQTYEGVFPDAEMAAYLRGRQAFDVREGDEGYLVDRDTVALLRQAAEDGEIEDHTARRETRAYESKSGMYRVTFTERGIWIGGSVIKLFQVTSVSTWLDNSGAGEGWRHNHHRTIFTDRTAALRCHEDAVEEKSLVDSIAQAADAG